MLHENKDRVGSESHTCPLFRLLKPACYSNNSLFRCHLCVEVLLQCGAPHANTFLNTVTIWILAPEYRTIQHPDTDWLFKYPTSLLFGCLLYMLQLLFLVNNFWNLHFSVFKKVWWWFRIATDVWRSPMMPWKDW